MKTFKIGQIADKTGLSVETIRYYEKRGLIKDPPRTDSGYRQYSEDVIRRLKFIKRAKPLGFTLSEIKELLELRISDDSSYRDIKAMTQDKLESVSQKIDDLEKIKNTLSELLVKCDESKPSSKCPILGAIEPEDKDDED